MTAVKQKLSLVLIASMLFIGIYGFAQSITQEELKQKIDTNTLLFQKNIDKAYLQLDSLLEKAIVASDSLSELILLERKCRYFYQKNQVDNLIKASDSLRDRAILYQDIYFQAMGSVYLSQAYSINNLHERALSQLDVAYQLLEKENNGSRKVFYAKANVLNSIASVYLDQGEPEKAVEKLQQVIKSYDALGNPEAIRRFQYLNYSNIAHAYASYNIDLAEYYALQSIALKAENSEYDKMMVTNFYVLGKVNKERKNFEDALNYYHKAIEASKISGEELEIKNIYTDLVAVYKETGQNENAILYENKLKEIEILLLQSKYNSLWDVIDQTNQPEEPQQKEKPTLILILMGSALLGIILYVAIFRKRKESKESIQEKYNTLIELVKNNDPAFIFAFEEMYPDFSEKLLAINPQLSKSEIEFCALLKLNLSTKKIAKLTFIETRTVQNKKHRIRKRLNIPQTADIYNWFNSF